MGIDKELLDILVCPKCKGDLELSENEDGLVCKPCALKSVSYTHLTLPTKRIV